jgi:hypothetical protein
MFVDLLGSYERSILLSNIVCDATEVKLWLFLADYVSFPFQFENKH